MAVLLTPQNSKDGSLYTDYDGLERAGLFRQRAFFLHARFLLGKALIAGCGPGYTVRHWRDLGGDVWGVDASSWAVSARAPVVLPAPAAARLRVGDVLLRSDMERLRADPAIGLGAKGRFAVIVTEELLPMLTDTEVAQALGELGKIGKKMFHIITPGASSDPAKLPGLNWKPIAGPGGWKAIVGADAILDAETGAIS